MVVIDREGRARFRVYLPHAASVHLIGDFTDWGNKSVALRRVNPGWWDIEIPLPAGEHRFCYCVDQGIWLADYAAHGVEMGRDGRWLSVVRVEEGAAGPGGGDRASSSARAPETATARHLAAV